MLVSAITMAHSPRDTRTFSSEVETGSRQENASNQESRAPLRFHRSRKGSGARISWAFQSKPALWQVREKPPAIWPRACGTKGWDREDCMRILRTLLTGLSVLLWPALAAAEDFPNKPIRLI